MGGTGKAALLLGGSPSHTAAETMPWAQMS